jgi:hypothetical protein
MRRARHARKEFPVGIPSSPTPLGLRVGVGHVTKTLGAGGKPAPLYHLYRIYTLLHYVTAATRIPFQYFQPYEY